MREPRSKQRFPTNGKELYELLRRDHEPVLIWVHIADEASNLAHYHDPNRLVYERFMDPMLYFWPVEKQHVVIQLVDPLEEAAKKRLVDALLRDGAQWVSVIWLAGLERPTGPDSNQSKLRIENYGDADGFMRDRHGTLDPLAVSGRGGGQN